MPPTVAVGSSLSRGSVFGRWVAATSLGFLLGYLGARATGNLGLSPLTLFGVMPRWFFTGLFAALVQSRLLGAVLPRTLTWTIVTAVAFALGGLIASIPTPAPESYVVQWAIGGGLIGTIQYLALRRIHTRPRWWPLVTLLGFGLAGLAYGWGFYLLPDAISRRLASILLWVFCGFVIALVTGCAVAVSRPTSGDHPSGAPGGA